MIGVISKQGEGAAVEEFFQLFKTPWELFRPGVAYDVVVITGDEPAEVDAKLVLVFGSKAKRNDRENKLASGASRRNARIVWNGVECPLYGELLTLGSERGAVLAVASAILADVEPGILPGGYGGRSSGVKKFFEGSDASSAEPGGKMPPSTSAKMADATAAAVEVAAVNPRVIRLGYDLFEEIAFLLTTGQPLENANIPTLDLHVAIVRDLILKSGVSLVEIPPTPSGYDFAVCLTHDIDFVGIRRHKFDHTMCGFLYRATAGAALNFVRGRVSFRRLMGCWKAALTLPFVYLGWAGDFWMPFEWYLGVEMNLSATYFLIPFKRRQGDRVMVPGAARRASAYDIGDIPEWITRLQAEGCEVGVHGIDAWNSVEKGRDELNRVAQFSGNKEMGIRMHWLCRDEKTCGVLERAGYSYDSTSGYNEVPGYLNGTSQVFLPPGAKTLLELPMHIQDGALFFPGRLGLTDAEATKQCDVFIANARKLGGVLTFIWHDRSHGPERFWGDFYAALVQKLKAERTWFGQARQVVGWFRQRREVSFKRAAEGVVLCGTGKKFSPPMTVRVHRGGEVVEMEWDGEKDINELARGCVEDQPQRVAAL